MSGDCIIYYTLYIIYNLPHSWWSSWSPLSPGSGCRSCILESRLKLKLATFDKYFWNQLGVSEFRYRLNFEKYFSNLLGCWSVFETCLAVDQLCRRSCQSRAPEEEIKSTMISSALQKNLDVRRQTARWQIIDSNFGLFWQLMFCQNLEVDSSVEQILHHCRVFVGRCHVQNILTIVSDPQWI